LEVGLPSDQNVGDYLIFKISSEGELLNILDFTKKIESGLYLVEIEDLLIQTLEGRKNLESEGGSEKGISEKPNATFNIKAFIKK
jgi:hypothetical protein